MKQNDNLSIIICHCEGALCDDNTLSNIKSVYKESADIFDYPALCTETGLKDVPGSLSEEKPRGVVVAGCSKVYDDAFLTSLANKMGIARDSLFPINIGTADIQSLKDKSDAIVKQIQKGYRAASFIPGFDKKTIPMNQTVLVLGGGIAGMSAARELDERGYRIILLEKESEPGGMLNLAKTKTDHTPSYHYPPLPKGIKVYTNSSLTSLAGSVGSFRAKVKSPGGEKEITCGAVVMATGRWKGINSGFPGDVFQQDPGMCKASDLVDRVAALPRKKETRRIAILLDYKVEETKASAEMAFHMALGLQKDPKNQVFIFSRETRVSAKSLEILFDEVQDAGVVIVKYEDTLNFNKDSSHNERTEIIYTDTLLQQPMKLLCDLIGISLSGISPEADPGMADLTGINLDTLGQFQDNNVHLFPGKTNRPGIFTAGACTGRDYIPDIITDAKATALAVHTLLAGKTMEIELSSVTVDEDKCILCLTCIRSCPFHAMIIDTEKDVAACLPEVCQKCGSCAGECPIKAITLPAYSDNVILSQID